MGKTGGFRISDKNSKTRRANFLKPRVPKYNRRHHEFVKRNDMSESYLFHKWRRICSNCRNRNAVLFSSHVTYRIKLVTEFVLSRATQKVPRVGHDLLTIPGHLIEISPVFGGFSVAQTYFLCCVSYNVVCLLIVLFLFCFWFLSWHECSFVFDWYEFGCPFGVFQISVVINTNFKISNCCNVGSFCWFLSYFTAIYVETGI